MAEEGHKAKAGEANIPAPFNEMMTAVTRADVVSPKKVFSLLILSYFNSPCHHYSPPCHLTNLVTQLILTLY
jgi:hypothetical protein